MESSVRMKGSRVILPKLRAESVIELPADTIFRSRTELGMNSSSTDTRQETFPNQWAQQMRTAGALRTDVGCAVFLVTTSARTCSGS